MTLEATLRRIDATSRDLRKLAVTREAVIQYTRGRITREQAERDMLASGWTPEQLRKLLRAADNNIILIKREP